jgi:hypothetical protein
MSAVAALGSLAEWHCEALWLIANLGRGAVAADARAQARQMALRHGLGNLIRGASDGAQRLGT